MNRLVVVAVLAPLVAPPATALVLRHFAPGPVHGARIAAAPPAVNGALAWQLLTEVEDRGVREAVPLGGLVATLRGGAFGERVWRGESNADGIAELHFDAVVAPGVAPVDDPRLTLEVRAEGPGAAEVLAAGRVAWRTETTAPGRGAVLPSSLREGDLAIDVAVAGTRLVAGFAVPLWTRVRDAAGAPVGNATLSFAPEPGLELTRATVQTCGAGWAEVDATAIVHVAELGLEATAAGGLRGRWHGSIPVAPGASYVALPRNLAPDHPLDLQVLLVGARDREYVEVDDARGRALGVVVPLSLGAEGRRHGTLALPALGATELGNAWLVTSSDPTLIGGEERTDGATLAHPLRPRTTGDPCADAGEAATLVAAPLPRWTALDGFASRDRSPELRRARQARGLAVGILFLAGVIETVVLLAASRRPRTRAADATGAAPEDALSPASLSAPRPWLVLTMIVAAWLGFALFAALILNKTGP